jgi:hypothetical protein
VLRYPARCSMSIRTALYTRYNDRRSTHGVDEHSGYKEIWTAVGSVGFASPGSIGPSNVSKSRECLTGFAAYRCGMVQFGGSGSVRTDVRVKEHRPVRDLRGPTMTSSGCCFFGVPLAAPSVCSKIPLLSIDLSFASFACRMPAVDHPRFAAGVRT